MIESSNKLLDLQDAEVHVWTTRFLDDDSITNQLLGLLDRDERARAAGFSYRQHRMRFIQFHAIARQILGGYLGLRAADVTFAHGPHGKPETRASGGRADIQFNLSHSGDYCLLAVRKDYPVGIDLEEVRDLPHAMEIAARQFAQAEAKLLSRVKDDARRDMFFALWTHKEAVIKALGATLADLDRMTFEIDPTGHPQLISFDGSRSIEFSLKRLDAPPGYAAALASLHPISKVMLRTGIGTGQDRAPMRRKESAARSQIAVVMSAKVPPLASAIPQSAADTLFF
jgi:4'-phosphopantetheinyl transferase